MTGNWELSYYVPTIGWDGKIMRWDPKQARARLEVLNRAGVQWMGVDGINLMEQFNCDVDATVATLTGWYKELGLKMSSFHYSGPTFQPLDGGQETVRANLARNVELFAQWSPRAFVIHSDWMLGTTGGPSYRQSFASEVERHGRPAVMDTIADNLRYMARLAARHDIRLACENLGPFCSLPTPQDLVGLVDAIGEPNVGFCLDAGHAHAFGEDVVAWVHRTGKRLYETHFHDNRGIGLDEHMAVGFGTIPWVDVIVALREINYPGPITFEAPPWPIEDPTEAYKQAVAWWRACENQSKTIKPRPEKSK